MPKNRNRLVETTMRPIIGMVDNCSKLNVRATPSKDAEVVCVINVREEVTIDRRLSNDEWVKVCTATGVEGFCMRAYIRFK